MAELKFRKVGRRSQLTQAQVAEMAKMYESGATMREIAKIFGISASTVGVWLHRYADGEIGE